MSVSVIWKHVLDYCLWLLRSCSVPFRWTYICCMSIVFNNDHFHHPKLWVHRWLNRSIHARKVLLQFGQGILLASLAAFIILVFLASLFFLAEDLWLLLYTLESLKMEERHCGLFPEVTIDNLILNAFNKALSESLNRFFWPPWKCFPAWSSSQKCWLGSRSSGIRTTWPAHPLLSLHQNAVNARDVCFGEHLMISVWNLILPSDVEEAHNVEVVQPVGMSVVDSPCFTSIQQGRNHYSLVDLRFGL